MIVPPIPGGFSALGLVTTDLRRDYARTFYAPLARLDTKALLVAYEAMESEARSMLRLAGLAAARWDIRRSADLRYMRRASSPGRRWLVSRTPFTNATA